MRASRALLSVLPIPWPANANIGSEIVRYGRMLHERGFVAATDGNLSVRLDENRILATPTCMSKGEMRPSDLVIVDMEGRLAGGRRNVSSEIGMHLLIYRLRPDVQGDRACASADRDRICRGRHARSISRWCAKWSSGWARFRWRNMARRERRNLTDALEPLVPQYDAILMSNHGVVAYGADSAAGLHEDGNGRALRADRAGHASARPAAAPGQRGAGEVGGGASKYQGSRRLRPAAAVATLARRKIGRTVARPSRR